MFVIVVGIAGVISSLWWAHSRTDSGKFMSEATNHARAFYEKIVSEGLIVTAARASAANWPDGTYGLVDENESDRTRLNAVPFDTGVLAFQPQALGQTQTTLSSGNTNTSAEFSSDLERFRRNIRITRLDPASRTAAEFYVDDLAEVQIRIYWFEKELERRVELKGLARHNVGT